AGAGMVAAGHFGRTLGVADVTRLERILREGIEHAYRRALANGEFKADARDKFGTLGQALADIRLCPIDVREDTVRALYEVDPRTVDLGEMVRVTTDVSRQGAAVDARVQHTHVYAMRQHPAELDRALKMETAYAGRPWLLRGLHDHQIGRRVASELVTAYSDPSLPGYGHYRYDDEGTPARRVVHIEKGVFTGFMNSRQTAAIFGGAPNGHWKASGASLVPLIRMSTTVFDAGSRDPA